MAVTGPITGLRDSLYKHSRHVYSCKIQTISITQLYNIMQ